MLPVSTTDVQPAKRPRRWKPIQAILLESIGLLFMPGVPVIAAIVPALWCWFKLLSPTHQVYTLLIIGAILNIFQVILGLARRSSAHWFVQYGALVAFYLPVPVVAFALGIVRSASHIEVDYFIIVSWLTLITLTFNRRANSMAAYSLNDTIHHGMRHAYRIAYPFYWLVIAVIACRDHLPWEQTLIVIPLSAFLSYSMIRGNFQRIVVPHIISSYKTETLAEYMMEEANYPEAKRFFRSSKTDVGNRRDSAVNNTENPCDSAINMKNCRYPFDVIYYVRQPDHCRVLGTVKRALRYHEAIKDTEKKKRLGQVCLSYSLFNMIKRRHYGFPSAEQDNARVLEFAKEGFPTVQTAGTSIADKGRRAFEVVEVQLAFLHDHFFIENSLHRPFSPSHQHRVMEAFALLGLLNSFFIREEDRLSLSSLRFEIIGSFLFAMAFFQNNLQYISQGESDSNQVSKVFRCFRDHKKGVELEGPLSYLSSCVAWLARGVTWYHRRYWQNKIGQYSLIEDCDNISVKKTLVAWAKRYLLDQRYDFISHHPLEQDPVILLDSVKEAVFSAFSRSGRELTNGISSLQVNRVSGPPACGKYGDISDTFSQTTYVFTILIWHVATWYCEVTEDLEVCKDNDNYNVATALSKYCAYLVAFLPEFLPDHSLTTTDVFQQVLSETKELLGARGELPMSTPHKIEWIEDLELPEERDDAGVVHIGADVGHVLMRLPAHLRWKVMADFWAETMLYIAPSDKVTAHIDQLAKGGEFVTHIWALLSDAGILARPPKEDDGGSESGESLDDSDEEQPNNE